VRPDGVRGHGVTGRDGLRWHIPTHVILSEGEGSRFPVARLPGRSDAQAWDLSIAIKMTPEEADISSLCGWGTRSFDFAQDDTCKGMTSRTIAAGNAVAPRLGSRQDA